MLRVVASRMLVLLAPSLVFAALAPAAWGGTSIGTRPSCEDSYLVLGAKPSATVQTEFRAALLCLINGARDAEGLPALKRSVQLESVANEQSAKFAKTGNGSHGASLSDIGKRDAKKGYHAAAYNEAYEDLGAYATPYAFLAGMLSKASVPCTEIFDPRFREVGIGANPAEVLGGEPQIYTLALEFGLRVGQRQPSTNTKPADSCPHKVPAPIVSGPVIETANPAPSASGSTVTLGLKCRAKAPCELTGTLSLPDAKAKATTSGTVTIPAGKTATLSFTFTEAEARAELAAQTPQVSLALDVTEPEQYTATLAGPLGSS